MRGESASAFMKRLSNSHPQLKKMNLDDLYYSAQGLCQDQGIDADKVADEVDTVVSPFIR